MRLICLILGHRWNHFESFQCGRCGEPYWPFLVMMHLAPLFDAVTKLVSHLESEHEQYKVKGGLEVVPSLTELQTQVLEHARKNPGFRDRLPPDLAAILDEEEAESATLEGE